MLAGDLGVHTVTVNGQQESRTTVMDEQLRVLAQITPDDTRAAAEVRDALAPASTISMPIRRTPWPPSPTGCPRPTSSAEGCPKCTGRWIPPRCTDR